VAGPTVRITILEYRSWLASNASPPSRVVHLFPLTLNLSLPCPYPLDLSLLGLPYDPN
jgi:hypothetical protein